jgi:nucleolar protein 15
MRPWPTIAKPRLTHQTGASKHYAYIEMSSQSVAEIVAETMNNYLLMGHLLKCQVIPAEEVHQDLWVGANKKFRKVPRARVEKIRNERVRRVIFEMTP